LKPAPLHLACQHSADTAELLAIVRSLPPAALADFLDGLSGLPCVEAAGRRVCERKLSSEKFPQRNRKIRELAKRLSYAQIGRLLGMSRYAVRNVVKRTDRSVNTQAMFTPSDGYDSKRRMKPHDTASDYA
jgi:hypothetical protein